MDNELLQAALTGYKFQRRELDTKIEALEEKLREDMDLTEVPTGSQVTVAAKRRMAEAQRKRWAKFRTEKAKAARAAKAPVKAARKKKEPPVEVPIVAEATATAESAAG